MASPQPLHVPDSLLVERLLEELRSPDAKARKQAISELVMQGSTIRKVLSRIDFHLRHDRLSVGDVTALVNDLALVLNDAKSPDLQVSCGVASTIDDGREDDSVRLMAIHIGEQLKRPHSAILNALVRTLSRLTWHDANVRRRAARALGALHVATPVVLESLVAALRDSDVADEALHALNVIGVSSQEVQTALAAQPDAALVRGLMKQAFGPDIGVHKRALTELVMFGSTIRELLLEESRYDDRNYSAEIAEILDNASDEKVFAGMANAIAGPNWQIRWNAVFTCQYLKHLPPRIMNALAEACGDWRKQTRCLAVNILCDFRATGPSVRTALVAALRDDDYYNIADVAFTALGGIGESSPDILAALVEYLERPNSLRCMSALRTLDALNAFTPFVIRAVRQLAVSASESPGQFEDEDDEAYCKRCEGDETRHRINREMASNLLARLPLEELVKTASEAAGPDLVGLSAENQQLLRWFEGLKPGEWLEYLQVFWCIGSLEHESLTQLGPAMGIERLEIRLKAMKAAGQIADLRVSQSTIRKAISKLESLFNGPPFPGESWTNDEKKCPDFRVPRFRGKRQEANWAHRARKVWSLIDWVLTVKGLRPKLVIEDTDK